MPPIDTLGDLAPVDVGDLVPGDLVGDFKIETGVADVDGLGDRAADGDPVTADGLGDRAFDGDPIDGLGDALGVLFGLDILNLDSLKFTARNNFDN